jgi:two-component system, OmpR family, phosphate regulon sensor histidine kinase PhoR
MLLAIMALMAFQWYWIKNAITVKNEEFDRKVMDVMKETSQKLEKQEVIYLAKQRMANDEKNRLVSISKKNRNLEKPNWKYRQQKPKVEDYVTLPDTLSYNIAINKDDANSVYTIDYDHTISSKSDGITGGLMLVPEAESEFRKGYINEEYKSFEIFKNHSSDLAKKQNKIKELVRIMNNETDLTSFSNVNDGYNWMLLPEDLETKSNFVMPKILNQLKQNTKKQNIEKPNNNQEKANLVKEVFKDFIMGKRNIYERVGHLMLDTLLKKEFKNNGVNIGFEYGVKDNENMVFSSFRKNQEHIKQAYKVKLFPHDTFPQEQYLQVYFPEKDNYILGNIWSVLGTSFLMIIMFGGIFYYSVNTMLNQKKLSNIKNDFINNMTHELKTPVSTIGLALEVIRDKDITKTPEKTERYLSIIAEENQRLGTQVEKVLQIAQLEKGDVKLQFEVLNVNKVLQQVVKNLSVQAEQLNAKITVDFENENLRTSADKVHLTNIFYNLLDNAIKYSKENPIINITTETIEDQIFIKIKDQGIGIPKDQLSKVFDKFYRVPKGNLHDVKGFGLGLSYVKSMLALHLGKISVNSKINEGSEFIVQLPTA